MSRYVNKNNNAVPNTTTESEYVVLYEAAKEFSYLKYLCQSLGIIINLPCIIHENNKGVVENAKNHTHHGRTKHFNPLYHYSRECHVTMLNPFSIIPLLRLSFVLHGVSWWMFHGLPRNGLGLVQGSLRWLPIELLFFRRILTPFWTLFSLDRIRKELSVIVQL